MIAVSAEKYRLSPFLLCGISFLVCFFVFGCLSLQLSPLVLVLLPIFFVVMYLSIRFGEVALYVLILITVLFNFGVFANSATGTGVTPIQAASGVVLLGISLAHIVKLKLFQRRSLFSDSAMMFIVGAICWLTLMSLIGIVLYGHTVELVMREIVLQIPLFMCPLFIVHYFGKSNEKRLFIFIIAMWAVTLIGNFVKYQSNIAQAFYLFEVGRSTTDITLTSLVLLIAVALAMHLKSPKHLLLVGGALLSIAAIVISMFRTLWLTDIMLVVLMVFFFTTGAKRIQGVRFLIRLGIMMVLGLIALAIVFPFVELMLRLFFERFLYSTAVTTDPSLVNRYIEWENILQTISSVFLTGLGFGAQFETYNWIAGTSYMTGYTHNGYLFLLLRGGIVGFLLLGTGYILFIKKAFKLLQSEMLLPYQLAIIKAALMILFGNLFISLTLNALAQREGLLWTGVIWGYLLFAEKQANSSSTTDHRLSPRPFANM